VPFVFQVIVTTKGTKGVLMLSEVGYCFITNTSNFRLVTPHRIAFSSYN